MTDELPYRKAPITEAIIDIRANFPAGVEMADLRQAGESLSQAYPHEESIFEAVGLMEVQPGLGGSTAMRQNLLGYKRSNEARNQIVQLRSNGFTFSRLSPYETWEFFRDAAQQLWEVYRTTVSVGAISRLAVRYINRIDIPSERADLKDYFRTSPEVSSALPQELEQFFMQLRIPQPEVHGTAILNQTMVAPVREGVTSIILDIDLFCDQDPVQDESGIWEFFEDLRRVKNIVFEACITDNTRKLFE